MINQIIKSEYLDLFEKFSKKTDPVLVANFFLSTLKDLSRKGIKTENLEENHFSDIFLAIEKKRMTKEAIPEVLELFCKHPQLSIGEVIAKLDIESLSKHELKEIIKNIFKKNPELVENKKISALMGEAMKQVRGKISGKIVMETIQEELDK